MAVEKKLADMEVPASLVAEDMETCTFAGEAYTWADRDTSGVRSLGVDSTVVGRAEDRRHKGMA